MTDNTVPKQWEHIAPPGGYAYIETTQHPNTGEQTFSVACYAPYEPPAPQIPPASGTWQDKIGAHHVKVEWIYKDGIFDIVDFDLTISLDDKVG